MKESEIKAQILDYLELHGALPFITGQKARTKFKSRYMRRGLSDIAAIWKGGIALFIEVKKPGGKVSDDQLLFISDVKKRGAIAFIADDLSDVIKELGVA